MLDQLKRPQLKATEPRRPAPPPLKPPTEPAMPMPSVFTRPLEQPPQKKQRKACPACEEEGTTCAGCQKKASPELERPPTGTQRRRGCPGEEPAERQADELGKDIGEELKGTGSVGHGPLPKGVQDVAETHLGVSLEGTYVDAGSSGQKKAKDESALAVTKGNRIAFGEGQLSTTPEGRDLLGHELVHVAQQNRHFAGGPVRQRQAERGSEKGATLAPWLQGAPKDIPVGLLTKERSAAAKGKEEYVADSHAFADAFETLTKAKTAKEIVNAERSAKNAQADLARSAGNYVKKADAFLSTLDGEMRKLALVGPGYQRAFRNRLGSERTKVRADRMRVLAASKASGKLLEQQKRIQTTEAALRRTKNPKQRRVLEDQLGFQKDRLLRQQRVVVSAQLGRYPPGTWGMDSHGRCYVVYQDEVRVGGSLGWRLRNRGSTGRPPSGATPPGTLAQVPPGKCGGLVGLFVFETEAASIEHTYETVKASKESVGKFLRHYLQGFLSDAESRRMKNDPDAYVASIVGSLSKLKVTSKTPIPKIKNDSILRRLAEAIVAAETGKKPKPGTTYTCGNAPAEYAVMLGCERKATWSGEIGEPPVASVPYSR